MDSKGGYPHPQPPPAYGFDNQPTHGAYIPPQTVYVEQPQGNLILLIYIENVLDKVIQAKYFLLKILVHTQNFKGNHSDQHLESIFLF